MAARRKAKQSAGRQPRPAGEILDELAELIGDDPELRERTLDWLGQEAEREASVSAGPTTGFVPLRRVAEELELNEWTLRQWVRDGKLRAYRIGKKVFVRPQDLAAIAEPWTPGEQIGASGADGGKGAIPTPPSRRGGR